MDEERAKCTLFVRGIPQDTTSQELEAFFGDIGPIRSCFIVTDKSDPPKSRGFGFVQFAIAEDAKRAIEQLKEQSFNDGAKKLLLDFAKHRHRQQGQTNVVVSEPIPTTAAKKKIKLDWLRVLLVNGVPNEVGRKQLYKKLCKFGHVCAINYPASISTTSHIDISGNLLQSFRKSLKKRHDQGETAPEPSEDDSFERGQCDLVTQSGAAQVLYLNSTQAENAALRLNDHIFKGKKITAKISPNPVEAKTDSRLMIRNIPFDCTCQSVADVFGSFGTLLEVFIPRNGDGIGKGFAFATYCAKDEAEKAIKALNEKHVENWRRTIVVDWALPKDQYVSARVKQEIVEEVETLESDASVELETEIIDNNSDSDDVSVEFEGDEQEPPEKKSDDDVNREDEITRDEEGFAAKKNSNQEKSDVHLGTTLFVKNIAFETQEEDLTEKFKAFGPLKYCKIAVDRETGKSKGTGFVQFVNKEDADNLIELAALSQNLGANVTIQSSSLVPETLSGIWLHGRQLTVFKALGRDEAEKKKNTDSETFKINDKRNTYLLKEGFIRSDSQAAKSMTAAELQKRQQSYYDRKRQLEKFPHLFVSPTRLSIRNIPKKIDEKQLKMIAKQSVIEWCRELNRGGQSGSLGKSEKLEWNSLIERHGMNKPVHIKQAKIIRDHTRLDPSANNENDGTSQSKKQIGMSKGYGFVEFSTHAHALGCLRKLNNNPSAIPETMNRRLNVEFAIENGTILKKRTGSYRNDKQEIFNKSTAHTQVPTSTRKKEYNTETAMPKVEPKRARGKPMEKTERSSSNVDKKTKMTGKRGRHEEKSDEFDSLVAKYKRRLSTADQIEQKSRWFD